MLLLVKLGMNPVLSQLVCGSRHNELWFTARGPANGRGEERSKDSVKEPGCPYIYNRKLGCEIVEFGEDNSGNVDEYKRKRESRRMNNINPVFFPGWM